MNKRILFDRLFIAVPELRLDMDFLSILKDQGIISDDEYNAANTVRKQQKKWSGFRKRMRNKSLTDRLIAVVPEMLTASNVGVLSQTGLIDSKTANALRLAIRAGGEAFGGKPPSEDTIMLRLSRVLGVGVSKDAISLIRALDDQQIEMARRGILKALGEGRQHLGPEDAAALRELFEKSVARAEQLRSVVSAGQIVVNAFSAAKGADGILKALFLIGPELLDPALIKAMQRAGVISGRTAEILTSAMSLGKSAWKNFARAAAAESLAQRILLISQGIITHEMVNFLLQTNVITKNQAALLRPAVSMVRNYTKDKIDELLDQSRRYRVLPGESPIQTFARGSQRTDRAILSEIARAAKKAGKTADSLLEEGGRGNRNRANQLRITRAALYDVMHEMWEGVGTLTLFGEAEAARLAQASMQELEQKLWRQYGKKDGDAIRRALYAQARAGVDSYISRHENLVELSKRVYKNRDLAMGKISQIINSGLLQGKSASEIAKDVEQYINPKVRGGVRYAAMRLARTEINNAFHFSAIRYTREMPWVTGYKWHLSGSHPKGDVCNLMASRDHHQMGPGVYKKSSVPGKPHPHCLCFITTVTVDPEQFASGMKAGHYKQYLSGFTG